MIPSMDKVSDPITITVPPLPFWQVLHIAGVVHQLAVAACLQILPPSDDDGAAVGAPRRPAPLSIGRSRSKVSKRIFDRHQPWHARLLPVLPTKQHGNGVLGATPAEGLCRKPMPWNDLRPVPAP